MTSQRRLTTDGCGRVHDYLRISVTDRCNLRCTYCMGPDGVPSIPHEKILRYEQILEVVAAAVDLGFRKMRITGGEPLVRRNVVSLVREIRDIGGVEDLSLTTNGVLLPSFAAELRAAGLNRVNISLDSLDPLTFRNLTRGGDLSTVLVGIEAALAEELNPVKLNVVLMRGVTEPDLPKFLELAANRPLHVRFIEIMPIGDCGDSPKRQFLSADIVLTTARHLGLTLTPMAVPGAGPAENYAVKGGEGSVGLIHAVSRHFCHECNRLRLTADGFLKPCLYWPQELSVAPHLGDRQALQEVFRQAMAIKRPKHEMNSSQQPGTMRSMSKTGG